MDAEELYQKHAGRWVRTEPISLSDFTGRPAVFELAGAVTGKHVLDLGSGEGYCSREFARRGADRVLGIELSAQMVQRAREAEALGALGIEYQEGNITELRVPDASFDLVSAVFVFNYVTQSEMEQALREVHRVLKPGGIFVFSVPHPSFPFLWSGHEPFVFHSEGETYFSARGRRLTGEIFRRDGVALPVQNVHKTFEDYFSALGQAGFSGLPIVRELGVTEQHIELDPPFFGPLRGQPLHVAFRTERAAGG